MRRALLLGVAVLVIVAGIVLALVVPGAPTGAVGEPHITRVFIPAIKSTCIDAAGLQGSDIGFQFTEDGALHSLDPGDGSITGLPPEQLAVLNDCLARYPIEPTQELPQDPYSRNLLYDYYSGVLKGCLEARVDDALPPIPSRADFVVRLYVWDPYRALARGHTLDELLQLISACPELPPYLALPGTVDPPPISHALASQAEQDCFAAAGVDTEPSQSWSIDGQTVELFDADGGLVVSFTNAASGVLAGHSLLNCLRSMPLQAVVSPPANDG